MSTEECDEVTFFFSAATCECNQLQSSVIYLFIYCLPEIINVTITCKHVWGRTVRLTL